MEVCVGMEPQQPLRGIDENARRHDAVELDGPLGEPALVECLLECLLQLCRRDQRQLAIEELLVRDGDLRKLKG